MNLAEKIKKLKLARAEKLKALELIFNKASDESRDLNEQEEETDKEIKAEVATIDKQLKQAVELERLFASNAAPVDADDDSNLPADTRPAAHQTKGAKVESNLPKGTAFTRFAMSLAASKGNLTQAVEIAQRHWSKSSPEVVQILRAAVAAGTTTDPNWAKPLVEYQNALGEFVDLLRPATILGRMSGLRQVPFNVKVPRQTAGASVGWVGETAPKPVSKLAFDQITMPETKVAGIVVISQELARFSSPSAEALVRDDMVAAIAQFTDQQFIDPAVAGVAGINPASITNGVAAIASSGATVANVMADLSAAMLSMVNIPLASMFWVMNPRTKIALLNMRTAQDVYAFPEVANGTLRGFPIVDSTAIGIAGGAGTNEGTITLIAAGQVMLADDGQVAIDVSTEAAVAMDTAGAGSLTSLWQNNLIGIRAERYIHWLKRRANAVAVIGGVTY